MIDKDNANLLLPNSGGAMGLVGLSETREALARAAKLSLAGSRWRSWHPMAELVAGVGFI